jgi:hypothetical protein
MPESLPQSRRDSVFQNPLPAKMMKNKAFL